MADTFFDFDTSLNNGDNLLPPDEDDDCDCLENEEEYDALNDETFGALEDASSIEDWEQQHEQLAEIAESSKHSEILENSISQLVLEESEARVSLSSSVWSYTPSSKNGDIFNSTILSSLQKASKSFIETHSETSLKLPIPNSSSPLLPTQPKKICTVEELEKSLIKSSQQQQKQLPSQTQKPLQQLQHPLQPPPRPLLPPPSNHHPQYPYHPMLQQPPRHHHPLHNHMPPPPMMSMPPPGLRHLPPPINHPLLGAGLLRVAPQNHPRFQPHGGSGSVPRPPGFGYPPHGPPEQFQVNHHYNFPPPPHIFPLIQQQQQHHRIQSNIPSSHQPLSNHQQQSNQRVRHDSSHLIQKENFHKDNQYDIRDEYAGLMSMKEKQWLLNIQMLQLNTGTPYFDDYYYTIFKERKSKSHKENSKEKSAGSRRQHRNSDRQENQNTLTPRVYTPLQFENSLGKLQCGSVTAPRKIIDVDIVMCDKDSDSPQISKETRKTKQLLLELEALYALILKAEDINNPLYISNMEKLREIKQKQRLRELELAPTPEQKQEVLKLFKLESEPVIENQKDYIMKITQGLLQEEKFNNFLNIRKGKMLVLRLLPHLMRETFSMQLLDLWSKILLSLPITGRRDMAGDNILPKFYPFFKGYVEASKMSEILEIVAGLVEVVRQENSRSTPLSHVGKSPLYFVVGNAFGLSALVMLLVRAENLMESDLSSEKQQNDWSNFLVSWAQQLEPHRRGIPEPIEQIPYDIFNKHFNRFNNIKEKRALIESYVVDPYS